MTIMTSWLGGRDISKGENFRELGGHYNFVEKTLAVFSYMCNTHHPQTFVEKTFADSPKVKIHKHIYPQKFLILL